MKGIILCVALLVHFGALAASAQGVGAIGGTVTDASGGVMPGVNVSLLSEGVTGGTQQTITDSTGRVSVSCGSCRAPTASRPSSPDSGRRRAKTSSSTPM